MIIRFVLSLLIACSSQNALAVQLNIFNTDSYTQLLSTKKNQPFQLIFWSVNCAPCLKHMQTLGSNQNHTLSSYIFVSTDGLEMSADVQQTIRQLGTDKASHWVIDTEQFDAIRAEIDISWYGETPRLYAFDSQHKRTLVAE